ncbi:MAG: glutamine amidotransferase-related protein, partial [Bacteroidota bacterium]
MRVLFIDNLDSFTFNLVHCMLVAGVEVEVLRNEGEDWPELAEKMADCDAWAVGPGPGRPPNNPPMFGGIRPMVWNKTHRGNFVG